MGELMGTIGCRRQVVGVRNLDPGITPMFRKRVSARCGSWLRRASVAQVGDYKGWTLAPM